MIIFIVAIAAVALGGAMYYRTANESTTTEVPTREQVTNSEPAAKSPNGSTDGIAGMLDVAENAADAMEQGMGGAGAAIEEAAVETVAPVTASDTVYADGSYTKIGLYTSPAGQEQVTVSITLADDVISSATFTGTAVNPASIRNQEKFAAGYSDLVVGKKLDDVALTVVNGSSLTGVGFMDALDAIKADAKL